MPRKKATKKAAPSDVTPTSSGPAPTIEDVAIAPEDWKGPRRCPGCGCWCIRADHGRQPWYQMGRPETRCTRTTWDSVSPRSTDGLPYASEGNPTTDCPCHGSGKWEAVGLVNPYRAVNA